MRCASGATQPPAPAPGPGAGGGGSSQPPPQWPGSGPWTFRRGVVLGLKGVLVWAPAALFWASLVWGANFFDYRTPEEVEEDEAEVQRLERFFDVQGLPEDEYLTEWTAKDEALGKVVEKLLRSQRFLECMLPGAYDAPQGGAGAGADSEARGSDSAAWQQQAGGSGASSSTVAEEADAVEVSYVLPPPGAVVDGVLGDEGSLSTGTGPRPWAPRLMVAHRLGSLALISVRFEHVPKAKDREERWACTTLRADLVAFPDGEPACEPICDLRGPVPHGVRYMRI